MEGDAAAPSKEPIHHARSYERYCPDCGDTNADYKRPNVFCKDCGSPWGTDSPELEKNVKACWNCGGKEGTLKDASD